MKLNQIPALVAILFCLYAPRAFALPKVDEPVPIGEEFDDVITIYPDSLNQARYWLVPSRARIPVTDGAPAFGLTHSGISDFDVDGVRALLTVTFQPYVDEKALTKAKASVKEWAVKQGRPEPTFSFVTPTETTCEILIGGQRLTWSGKPDALFLGGSIDAGIPFQVAITNQWDVRALAQADGGDTHLFGVLYTMKFDCVRRPVKFTVRAKLSDTLDYVQERVNKSQWWGLSKKSSVKEWQDFRNTAKVELVVESGTEEDVAKFHAAEILQQFTEAVNNRSGAFARSLPPPGVGAAPTVTGGVSGALAGVWGYRLASGWGTGVGRTEIRQRLDVVHEVRVDAQFTKQHAIIFGNTFALSEDGPLKNNLKNLTDGKIRFPSSDQFKAYQARIQKAMTDNRVVLATLKAQKKIDDKLYEELMATAIRGGPYVDLSSLPQLLQAGVQDPGQIRDVAFKGSEDLKKSVNLNSP